MRSGPHQINIGWLVLSRIRTAVRRLCGQPSGGPSGFAAQSKLRVNAPISPPPARKSAVADLLIFNIGINGGPAQIVSRNLARLSQSRQTRGRPLGSRYFLEARNKMPDGCANRR